MRLEDRLPGLDRARHRDGMDRIARDRADALREQRLGRRARRRRGRSRCSPRPACRASRSGRSSRRRCRSCAARPRTAPRPPPPPHRRHCRRRAASRSRSSVGKRMRGRRHAVAGDDRRAAGQMKIAAHGTLWRWRRYSDAGHGGLDVRRVLSIARSRSGGRRTRPADHVDEAEHDEQEEGRGRRLRHQHELDQHRDEQQQRQHVVDDRLTPNRVAFRISTNSSRIARIDQESPVVTARVLTGQQRGCVGDACRSNGTRAEIRKDDDVVDRERDAPAAESRSGKLTAAAPTAAMRLAPRLRLP